TDTSQIVDHYFVEFNYPSGAVIASQCRHQPDTMSRVAESFQTTEGTIDTSGDSAKLKTRDGKTLYDHDAEGDPNPYQQEHNELFSAIIGGTQSNNVEYAENSTMTAL